MDSPAAVAAPPKKAAKLPKKEFHTSEVPLVQPENFIMPGLDEPLEHPENHIEAVEHERLHKEHLDALAFAEEPVEIRIEPSREPWAAQFVEAWVQGKGIEILINGRWHETKPCGIPVGRRIWTKRKYIEVLMRSLTENIKTKVTPPTSPEGDWINELERRHSSNVPLSILTDKNPKGQEWATRILGIGYS